MDRIIKSIFWLTLGSGMGYGLYVAFTPSEEYAKKLKKEFNLSVDDRSKNQKILDILEASAQSEKPIYRMTKEELAQLSKKRE